MTSFRTLTRFPIFKQKVPISPKWPISAIFFGNNLSAILPPLYFSFKNKVTQEAISPNLSISPTKTHAISQFFQKFFQFQYRRQCKYRRKFPISPKFFQIFITNYFVCVVNDIIFKNFSNLLTFCPHIAESVNTAEKPNIAGFFWQKTFDNIELPLYFKFNKYVISLGVGDVR